MSDSEYRALDPGLPVTDLLAYNEAQLVEYLEAHTDGSGGYDVSELVGVQELSRDRKIELAGKINAALARIESRTLSQPLEINELHARLANLADADADTNGDGFLSSYRRLSQSSDGDSDSSGRTRSATGNEPRQLQESAYRMLLEDGGRPICSLEHWSHLLTDPTPSYEAVLPWLTDNPDSKEGQRCLERIFTRQISRWCHFRKAQWDNRGIGDSDEGTEAYLEFCRRRYQAYGRRGRPTITPFLEGELRRAWQGLSIDQDLESMDRRLQPEDPQLRRERQSANRGFRAHIVAVKRHIAPYNFGRPIQLKRNPRQQTRWTEWLEYLSYEKWWLEELTAFVEPLEKQYGQAVKRLIKLVGDRPVVMLYSADDLKAAQEALYSADTMLNDFHSKTVPFLDIQKEVCFHRSLVEWVVKEARLMEAEMRQQDVERKTRPGKHAKSYENNNGNAKRHHDDENEELPLEKPPKRPKRGNGASTVSDTTLGKPKPRRSNRLARKKESGS
ncbi:hypothetical protein F5Y10DRAFT_257118 [Nemania abortiva]|nr:hypothetical protein F5Y10DRAFT_257118 [Nemania abortiva]